MSWTGWYPFLFSTSGWLGHTYLQGAEVAHNITLIVLLGLVAAGMMMTIHGITEM